jgi:hypothetical protein
VRCGDVVLKPAIERLIGGRVCFVDGSEERIDRIVYATRYRISLPFSLPRCRRPTVATCRYTGGSQLRRCAGCFSPAPSPRRAGCSRWWRPRGQWIAAVLTGRLRLPAPEQMDWAIERAERRTRQRFPQESPGSVRCDPHAYRRVLRSDLRVARRRVWHAATASRAGKEATVRPVPAQREQPAA